MFFAASPQGPFCFCSPEFGLAAGHHLFSYHRFEVASKTRQTGHRRRWWPCLAVPWPGPSCSPCWDRATPGRPRPESGRPVCRSSALLFWLPRNVCEFECLSRVIIRRSWRHTRLNVLGEVGWAKHEAPRCLFFRAACLTFTVSVCGTVFPDRLELGGTRWGVLFPCASFCIH